MIHFDLNGRKLALEETIVHKLRAEALARSGSSTTLNDLAVILSRALSEGKPITLRRAESRALDTCSARRVQRPEPLRDRFRPSR
jgi:hypothetical protein